MKIVNTSIKNPVFITMIILLFVVMGLLSYTRLGVDLLPDISLPIVAVTTVNPGVGPEEMEQQVSKPIEDIISSLNGLKKVSSTSSEGFSIVTAEFDLGIDADKAASDVREKISTIRSSLPREIQEPVIDKFDPSASPIISFAVLSKNKKNLFFAIGIVFVCSLLFNGNTIQFEKMLKTWEYYGHHEGSLRVK